MIKLDPMATVPDTARARPTYLSSTMNSDAGGEGERSRAGGCGSGNVMGAHVSDVQARTTIIFSTTRIVI
jgi:hypothetical protein